MWVMVTIKVKKARSKFERKDVGIVDRNTHTTIDSGDDKIKAACGQLSGIVCGRDYKNEVFVLDEDKIDVLMYALRAYAESLGPRFEVVCYNC